MKVALCLQGQPRDVEMGSYHLKKKIIENYDTDIFGHTWWDKNLVGKPYSAAPFGAKEKKIEENAIDELHNIYKFTKFSYESPKNFITDKKYRVLVPEKHDLIIDSLFSRYYSLKQVLTLLEQYEKETNVKYEWIFISRYDIWIEFLPNLILLNPTKIYVEDWLHSGRKFIFNDNLWVICRKHRFIFKSLFDNIDKNYEMILNKPLEYLPIIKNTELEHCTTFNGEEFMAFHLLFNDALEDVIQDKRLKYNPVRYYTKK